MQASFISPVCSRTRSQVAKRSAKLPALNYDVSLTNVISATCSSYTGINKSLVYITPSCDPSDEICKANLDSALTEVHSSVSFISPRSPIITGFVPSSEINSVASSVSTLQSNSVLGDDLSSDSSNAMLLPSLDISFQDLSEASNDDLFYDIGATASTPGLVGLEEGGGLITAGESSKSSDMLYSKASSSDAKEELISASASDSRDCRSIFSNGGRTAIGKSSMSTEVDVVVGRGFNVD
ncbi:hypothetical protein AVEN_119356-1 [Araneus ventricosus]|uniref:Uncharacterized protein n=1 Tax=Araneus ventricosus TaxID=182803 RepID=A0A4Y2PZA3_ARAVE|nr:hypothetical protein AVEN_119356-1 [Araneus ventricosus]